MSLDKGIYGTRNSPKAPKEISSSNILSFTSILSPLISSARTTNTVRSRPSRSKPDIFKAPKKKSRKCVSQVRSTDNPKSDFDPRKSIGKHGLEEVDEATLHRSKRKMEAKAKIYSQMMRGEISENTESLIDFDQKWAERYEIDSSTDIEGDDYQDEMVDYEDEFGRACRGTRADVEKLERKKRIALLSAEELRRMSALPEMPANLIYGNTVQTLAFNPEESIATRMKELAGKRDRSLTPPELRHYEADKEVRTKGVGFYSFSKDENLREQEIKSLEAERIETERRRKEKEEKRNQRMMQIEERRKIIRERRAKKQADSFLDSLDAELDSV